MALASDTWVDCEVFWGVMFCVSEFYFPVSPSVARAGFGFLVKSGRATHCAVESGCLVLDV